MPDAGERMNTQERNWNNGVGSFICVCVRQVTSVMSHSVQLYGPWPVRPLCPWDSPTLVGPLPPASPPRKPSSD